MIFFALTFLTGIILSFGTLFLERTLRIRWNLTKSFYWKAGLWNIVIGTLYAGFIGNLSSVWPSFQKSPQMIQALVVGSLSGLFFELGRYVILDKVLQKIRGFRESVYFALGWTGVITFLTGILLILGSIGMYFLIQIQDLKSQFPKETQEQLKMLQDTREQMIQLSLSNPFSAFAPFIESSSKIVIDMAMTLLIVYALTSRKAQFAWGAVVFHALVIGFAFYVGTRNSFSVMYILMAFALLAAIIIRRMRLLSSH